MTTILWRRLVAGMLVLGVVYACIVAYVLAGIMADRPLPFTYADTTPAGSYPRALCPGEPLRFVLRVTVADAPSVVIVAQNWQAAAGVPTVPDRAVLFYIQERSKTVEAPQSVTVPELPAGDWVYERAASVWGVRYPALLQIPFTVRPGC